MTWRDARNSLTHEQALTQYSDDGGATWSTPVNGAEGADRPNFPAVAISPDGNDVYLTYDVFFTPWQDSSAAPGLTQGVTRHADRNLIGWSTLRRGRRGAAQAQTR